MTLETNQEQSDPPIHRLEDPIYVQLPISVAILSILTDRLVTVLFWELEANPVVQTLGVYRWIGLTLILIGGMLFAWYPAMGVDNRLVRVLVAGIAIVHVLMAAANLAVVILS